MIPHAHASLCLLAAAPQQSPVAQRKLAFKRYADALAQGDEEEAADALANWRRLGVLPVPPKPTGGMETCDE